MKEMPHKPGFVEKELRRIASKHPEPVSERYFQTLVAEALLMILERLPPPGDGESS